MNTPLPACLRKYAHLIESVSDERGGDDGYWVYLKTGWRYNDGTYCVHEDTPTACAKEMTSAERCTDDCCQAPKPKRAP